MTGTSAGEVPAVSPAGDGSTGSDPATGDMSGGAWPMLIGAPRKGRVREACAHPGRSPRPRPAAGAAGRGGMRLRDRYAYGAGTAGEPVRLRGPCGRGTGTAGKSGVRDGRARGARDTERR
ncbi:hypothetical protein Sros01_20970 [Streptomyces roseochromogenus]|nr:hypothetical protein Sros01_20970 [Streptomyces roseochromogenus]